MTDRRRAYGYLVLTTAIWGSLYIVGKIVLNTIPPVTMLLLRFVLASAVLWLLLRARPHVKIDKKDYKSILLVGALGYFVAMAAQMVGIKYANASVASLINAMNPVVIILMAAPLLHEKLSLQKLAAVALTVLGAYFIIGSDAASGQLVGILFSIGSVILWSFTSITVRKLTAKYDPLAITCYGMMVAAVCMVPVSAVEIARTPGGLQFSWQNVLGLLYMAFICTGVAHYLWNKSLSMLEAGTCSLFYPVQPLVASILGVVFLHEQVTLSFVVGGLLVVAGILCGTVQKKP